MHSYGVPFCLLAVFSKRPCISNEITTAEDVPQAYVLKQRGKSPKSTVPLTYISFSTTCPLLFILADNAQALKDENA